MQEWERDTIVQIVRTGLNLILQKKDLQACIKMSNQQMKLDYYSKVQRYLTKVRCTNCEKYYPLGTSPCPECRLRIRTKARSAKSKRLREYLITRY
jgi:hypothetical protein